MRRGFLLACATTAAAAACATAGDELHPPNDPPLTPPSDAGLADAPPERDGAPPAISSCSAAGWCVTPLPDVDLTLKDIQPFEGRAFAVGESRTLGVKVLEWDGAKNSWNYIDDNTQNSYESGQYAGKLWSPGENEIYYGVAPRFIYHGTRSAPGAPWTWEHALLDNHSRDTNPKHDPGVANYSKVPGLPPVDTVALGVWGPSPDDVYAWYGNAIFHRKSQDGGPPTWVAEYIADDTENPNDAFFIFAASGTSSDDIWFAAGRGRHDDTGMFACPVALHRTPSGYRRIVDSVINEIDSYSHYYDTCHEKGGVQPFLASYFLPGLGLVTIPWTNGGLLTNIEAAGPSSAAGIVGGAHFAYLSTANDADVARVNYVNVHVPRLGVQRLLSSVWIHGTETWISGWGLVLRTETAPEKWRTGLGLNMPDDNEWDAGTFGISTTVLGGAPLDAPLYQVRGTSNTNLWAIGTRYALHKTTP